MFNFSISTAAAAAAAAAPNPHTHTPYNYIFLTSIQWPTKPYIKKKIFKKSFQLII
jgi:hypothetical protein